MCCILNFPRKKYLSYLHILLVKTNYYKLARKFHPDRVSVEEKAVANDKFTIIHQAYTILTNSDLKKRYDNGESDVIFSKKTRSGHWERHMKVVSDDDFEQSAQEYKNSAREKEDVMREIVNGNGSITHLLNHIPFLRVEDQPRIIAMIKELMDENKIPSGLKIKKIKVNF